MSSLVPTLKGVKAILDSIGTNFPGPEEFLRPLIQPPDIVLPSVKKAVPKKTAKRKLEETFFEEEEGTKKKKRTKAPRKKTPLQLFRHKCTADKKKLITARRDINTALRAIERDIASLRRKK